MQARFLAAALGAGLALAAGSAWGQEEREASASLGVAINSGNTESQRYDFVLDYLERSDRHRYAALVELARGEDADGEEDVNNSRAQLNYDWFFHGPWYANGNLSWRQDRMRDLRQRWVTGAGLGYQLFDDERTRLSVEAGPSYISEETLGGERSREGAARWALDFRHYLGAERGVRFFHRHELVALLDDTDDWFITTRTGLRMPVMNSLSASIQLNYDYDNEVGDELENYDATTTVQLTYEW